MVSRRSFYTTLSLLLTALTLCIIVYINKIYSNTEMEYMYSLQNNYSQSDDYKYLGYIFDDYNENVNLNFTNMEMKP